MNYDLNSLILKTDICITLNIFSFMYSQQVKCITLTFFIYD